MNFSLPLGLFGGLALMALLTMSEMKNPLIMGNLHGILMVFGGTFAAALVCFPFNHLFNMFKVFYRALSGKQRKDTLAIIGDFKTLATKLSDGEALNAIQVNSLNPFFKESLKLLEEDTLSDDELSEVLSKRIEIQHEFYRKENNTFKVLGKFPPAFGLIGATLGMISLLQGLGSPDAFEKLGPSMSVALTATFWGLLLANMVLIPIGEKLSLASDQDLIIRRIVCDGILLLKEKKHPILVEEFLNSYLSPKDRNQVKSKA